MWWLSAARLRTSFPSIRTDDPTERVSIGMIDIDAVVMSDVGIDGNDMHLAISSIPYLQKVPQR